MCEIKLQTNPTNLLAADGKSFNGILHNLCCRW